MRCAIAVGLVAATMSLVAAGPSRAGSRCTALEYEAAGQATAAQARCKAAAARRGQAVDPRCVARAEAQLRRTWTLAQRRGDCGSADLASAQAAIDGFIGQLMDTLEPPTSTAVCCNAGNACWHRQGFPDEAACEQFGGTPGAPGTVCDGATGSCQQPPVGTGPCCSVASYGVCTGGPTINLAGCVAAGGEDFPFFATCLPSGDCALTPPPP